VPVQRRYVRSEFHVRTAENGHSVIDGHGAVFNKLSQNLGGFVERVLPGAFRKTIAESDVRALFNHDSNLILARSASGTTTDGTLRLAEDTIGLAYDFDVPDTQAGRDLVVSMGRGDVSQSSFSWYDDDGEWSLSPEGFPLWTIIEVRRLADVSPVTYPRISTPTAVWPGKRSGTSPTTSTCRLRRSSRQPVRGGWRRSSPAGLWTTGRAKPTRSMQPHDGPVSLRWLPGSTRPRPGDPHRTLSAPPVR